MEAGAQVKQHGLENDLVERIRSSEYFLPIRENLNELLDAKTFIGRAPQQVSWLQHNKNERLLVFCYL